MMNHLGTFIEERDGVKCVVEKWELVTPVEKHNAEIDAKLASISALKIKDDATLGKVETITK